MAQQFSVTSNTPWKKRFFTIWSGQALSILGSQLIQFALIWFLTVKTGSATILATASLFGMLPGVLLGPFIGTIVDRWNRRWIMILADSLIALFTLTLAILFILNKVEIGHIYGIMFLRSLAGCFHGNAMNASTSLLVPVEHLTRIQGINQMLNGGLNIVAAPLGALLLSILPMQGILAIDILTAIIAVLPLCFLQIPEPERSDLLNHEGTFVNTVWQDFKAGFHYLVKWPGLMILGLGTIGINFTIIPAFSLLPLMVKAYLGGNAIHLGWVESSMGIGMLAGGALLGGWGGFKRKIVTSMLGLLGMGAGTLILAIAPTATIMLAICGTFLVGLMSPLTMGPFFAIIQSNVAPNMQARILSLLSSIGTAMVPLGLMIAGPVSDIFGIQVWFFLGGFLCIFMGIAGFFIPALMKIEERKDHTITGEKLMVLENKNDFKLNVSKESLS